MAGLFNKKRTQPTNYAIADAERLFIKAIINSLRSAYPNFQNQLDNNFFLHKKRSPTGRPGTFMYGIDQMLFDKYRKKGENLYIIRNIRAFDNVAAARQEVEIYVLEGLIIGYYTKPDISALDPASIDVSAIYEKHFVNEEKNVVGKIFEGVSKEALRKLEIENTFRIDLNGEVYYTIKSLENGNYVAVTTKGEVFGLIHDPFEVSRLYSSLDQFIADLMDGQFDLDKYIERKH
jgi:hypothetical protein